MRAVCLCIVLILAKLAALAGRNAAWSFGAATAYFWQDFLVVLAFALVDYGVRQPIVSWSLYWAIAVWTAINVPLYRLFSSPMTWTMLRAARGSLADSLVHHLTGINLGMIAAVLLAAASFQFLGRRLNWRRQWTIWFGMASALFVATGHEATRRVETNGLHRNAVFTLAVSTLSRGTAAQVSKNWRLSPFGSSKAQAGSRFHAIAAGRNIVVIILESTGAMYLKTYGAENDPTPNLTRLAANSLLFENAYSVYPESIKGLFTVLCSRFPAVDTKTELYASIDTPSLPAILHACGYRTALFHSGRFMYLGMESIVRNRGFEVTEDAGDIGGNHNSSFGVDEPATVRRILQWIDSLTPESRFFLTYLPIAGHHPYWIPESGPFPDNNDRNRYRNALHYGDAALGELIRGFQARGLDRNTVFVIFGDHGEAFGEHEGNYGHTLFLYEENIHVPYFISAPGLFDEQRRLPQSVSLIDTAPTILDLLGLQIPDQFQGLSAIVESGTMALFYADYSLALLGLRDGRWKFIYEWETGRSRLFNLDSDPGEKENVALQYPERVGIYRSHLLQWSETQKYWIQNLREPRPASVQPKF